MAAFAAFWLTLLKTLFLNAVRFRERRFCFWISRHRPSSRFRHFRVRSWNVLCYQRWQ